MAVSKLFTPVLRASQPTAIEKNETAEIFVNPPTHPEIPFFSGNSNDDGKAIYPLKLGGGRGTSIKENKTFPIYVRDDIDPE